MVPCGAASKAVKGADVCVRAACMKGDWLTGFSCQVTRGHATGFYVSDHTGHDAPKHPLAQVNMRATVWLPYCYFTVQSDSKVQKQQYICVGDLARRLQAPFCPGMRTGLDSAALHDCLLHFSA